MTLRELTYTSRVFTCEIGAQNALLLGVPAIVIVSEGFTPRYR